ncbi:helix-turn-helix domain-containing protein [Streptomyces sp. NPDC002537]
MPTPERLTPSKAYAARFGALLRELRIAQGWTQAELGRQVRMSDSAISKFETGERVPPPDIAEMLDKALGANGCLLAEWDGINDNSDARWAHRMLSLEANAASIHHFSIGIPALLQTESYARAFLTRGMSFYGGNLEDKVQFRMQRGRILHREDPPLLSALIFESALDLNASTNEVMREQLQHLAEMSERPHVHLRVILNNSHGLIVHGHMSITKPRSGRMPTLYTATVKRGMFSTDPDELAWHQALFEEVQRGALTEDQSTAFLEKSVEEKYPCSPSSLT